MFWTDSPFKRIRIPFLFLIALLSGVASLGAEETHWVIAAEAFTAKGVPSVYETFPEILPRLVLSRIASIRERLVLPDEKQLRAMQAYSDERFKLVRERAELVLSRDKILLSSDDFLVKKRKKNEAKKEIQKKEKAIEALNRKISDLAKLRSGNGKESKEYQAATNEITLWNGGKDLYARSDTLSLANSLAKDKISALISGSVEDIAGYMYVTVRLDTGIGGMPLTEVSEAASYDDIDELVAALTVRILPGVANRKPVRLEIRAEPEEAQVYIDGKLIPKDQSSVTVFSGEHTVSVSAIGYATVSRKASFDEADAYRVEISLEKEETVSVTFDTKSMGSSFFFHTRYFGESPVELKIPFAPVIGELASDSVQTWFVYLPEKDTADGARMEIKANKRNTGKKIESQRNFFYWSLGALYLSLPVSMLSYGIAMNKYDAYQSGVSPQTQDQADEVNKWMNISQVSRNVSIGLGINVAIQLFRYLLAANQVIPEFAKPDKN